MTGIVSSQSSIQFIPPRREWIVSLGTDLSSVFSLPFALCLSAFPSLLPLDFAFMELNEPSCDHEDDKDGVKEILVSQRYLQITVPALRCLYLCIFLCEKNKLIDFLKTVCKYSQYSNLVLKKKKITRYVDLNILRWVYKFG